MPPRYAEVINDILHAITPPSKIHPSTLRTLVNTVGWQKATVTSAERFQTKGFIGSVQVVPNMTSKITTQGNSDINPDV